jgi:hypothetical protein
MPALAPDALLCIPARITRSAANAVNTVLTVFAATECALTVPWPRMGTPLMVTCGPAVVLKRSGQLPRDKKKLAVLNSDSQNSCEAISMVASSPHNSDPGIAVRGYSARSDCKWSRAARYAFLDIRGHPSRMRAFILLESHVRSRMDIGGTKDSRGRCKHSGAAGRSGRCLGRADP